jgi:hypothetical protein
MTIYGSQTILESSQAPPPNNCLRSVRCHYRSLYLIYYCRRGGRLPRCNEKRESAKGAGREIADVVFAELSRYV